jgi:hypothetical protein
MNRRRAAVLAILLAGVLAAAYFIFREYRSRSLDSLSAVLRRLPTASATVLHIDVAALRRGGLLSRLAGSKLVEEPEYRQFVESAAFDYRTDLDAASIAFAPDGVYFLLRGRFLWRALAKYAETQGGACRDDVCDLAGSRPERKISFLLLRPDLLAMAVTPRPGAAAALRRNPASTRTITPPDDPIWVSVARESLAGSGLPTGARAFARPMQNCEDVTISFAGAPAGRFEARLIVDCRSADAAGAVAAQLSKVTTTLRDMIAREGHQPNPNDLSGVLTSGVFEQQGQRVRGRWLLEPGFVDSMLAGAGQ